MKKIIYLLLLFPSLSLMGQNVGINTTSPQATLHVAGDFKFVPKGSVDATRLVGVTASGVVNEFPLGSEFNIVDGTLELIPLVDENVFYVGDVDQSPTALLINTYNDYDIGVADTNENNTILRIFGETAGYNVTGIANGYDGRVIYFYNAQNNNVTFYDLDSRSDPQNQIITGTGGTIGCSGEGVVEMIYDEGAQKWIIINIRN